MVVCLYATTESTTGIIYPTTKVSQPVPRHTEINEHLAKRILKILGNL